ncbi:glucose-6-phosphate dehydrogenase, partial [Candidatus Dojkabacteria bacterium]|nr:glucose-6-phosphate dehydrogenase [Candidatus Dojkabacteria bacterium]
MTITKFDFLVIFGATGDLVERKVIPSLYHLFTSGKINSKDFRVFAFARRDFTNGKYDQIIDNSLKAHFKNPDFKTEADFYSIFEYVQGDLNNRDSFVDLNKK